MIITLSNETITFSGVDGAFTRKLAARNSRDANTFTNTIPADVFAKVAAFCNTAGLVMDDENTFANLKRFAANHKPVGMSAAKTKALAAQQKANVKAIAAL